MNDETTTSPQPEPVAEPNPVPTIAPAPHITSYFSYDHLPDFLQPISAICYEAAMQAQELLPEGAEKAAGLRKLLEAKDCFVRAGLRLRPQV